MKFLKIAIPVGTLLVLFLGWVAARFGERPAQLPEILPQPSATLPAFVFAAEDEVVEGRIVDARQAGVADALVWLREHDEPHWTYTDREGAFRLERVGHGPWSVVVLAHGFAPYRGGLADDGSAHTIAIGDPLAPLPAFEPIARAPLTGRVTSALVPDLDGYEIVITPTLAPETLGAPLPRRARCDREGHFEIADLAHGEYTLRVLPAWARGGSWPDLAGDAARAWTHDALSSPRELAVPLECGEIRGALQDTSGGPLEGALVLISPADDASRVWPPISTAADGTFVARDLPNGSYRVSIRAGSAAVQLVASVVARQSTMLDVAPLDIARGH